jgi:hypothetical protein
MDISQSHQKRHGHFVQNTAVAGFPAFEKHNKNGHNSVKYEQNSFNSYRLFKYKYDLC